MSKPCHIDDVEPVIAARSQRGASRRDRRLLVATAQV
jgi:hypothetical protein